MKINQLQHSYSTKEEGEEFKAWLEDVVKLPQYYEIFMKQGFGDLESICDLTLDDLKSVGIDKVGHQKKLIKYAQLMSESKQQNAAYSQDIWFCSACDTPNRYDSSKCILCNRQR